MTILSRKSLNAISLQCPLPCCRGRITITQDVILGLKSFPLCREYYFQTCSSFAPFTAALATLFFPDFTVKADGRNYKSCFLTYLQEQQSINIRVSLLFQMHIVYIELPKGFLEETRHSTHRPINFFINSSIPFIAVKNDNHLITD